MKREGLINWIREREKENMNGESIACPDCKQNVPVVTPELQVVNHNDLSMIFGLHPMSFGCPSCGSHFKPAIVGAQAIQWQWIKVEPPAIVQLLKPNSSRIHLAK